LPFELVLVLGVVVVKLNDGRVLICSFHRPLAVSLAVELK